MDKLPFSAYDFFGYLASGFLVVLAGSYIGGYTWLTQDDIGVTTGLLLLTASYIVGQVLASPSAWLYERVIVRKVLRRPNQNLFASQGNWWRFVFPGYYTPLPAGTQKAVIALVKDDGSHTGEALFLHAFGVVKLEQSCMSRLSDFRNMYGFCRNVSFACLLIAVAMMIKEWGTWEHQALIIAAYACAIGMFYRYLKFLRQYSYELFVSYVGLSNKR